MSTNLSECRPDDLEATSSIRGEALNTLFDNSVRMVVLHYGDDQPDLMVRRGFEDTFARASHVCEEEGVMTLRDGFDWPVQHLGRIVSGQKDPKQEVRSVVIQGEDRTGSYSHTFILTK